MAVLLIALQESLPAGVLDEVKVSAPDCDVITPKRTEIERHLDTVEIAVGSVPRDLVVAAPNLKWFQQWSVNLTGSPSDFAVSLSLRVIKF